MQNDSISTKDLNRFKRKELTEKGKQATDLQLRSAIALDLRKIVHDNSIGTRINIMKIIEDSTNYIFNNFNVRDPKMD